MRALRIAAIWAGILFLGALPAAASEHHGAALMLRLRWRLVAAHAAGVGGLAADSRYVAFTTAHNGKRTLVILDERTGKKTRPSHRGCAGVLWGFADPWLQACGGADGVVWLYNPARHAWRKVSNSRCSCAVDGVGTYWVKWESVPQGHETFVQTFWLTNIQTRFIKPDPARPGGRIYDDLNSRSGERSLCSPIRYPIRLSNAYFGPSLSFYGAFALSMANATPQEVVLERCRSSQRLRLQASRADFIEPDIASTGAVVMPTGRVSDKLDGVFLPSLRRFVIPVSKRIGAVWTAVISQRTVYIVAGKYGHQIWAAQLPTS